MADSNPEAASNSLGLDLDALKIKDDPAPADAEPPAQDASPSKDGASSTPEGAANGQPVGDDKDATESKKEPKEKKKPYVNPDRVKTGGAQRVCPCRYFEARCSVERPHRRSQARKSWRSAWRV